MDEPRRPWASIPDLFTLWWMRFPKPPRSQRRRGTSSIGWALETGRLTHGELRQAEELRVFFVRAEKARFIRWWRDEITLTRRLSD